MWITKEVLLNIFDHSLELRIWDSKDKVSARARFDRPKAFRLPAGGENEEDAGNHGGNANVKALVLKQSLSHAQLQPKESRQMRGKSLVVVGARLNFLLILLGHETEQNSPENFLLISVNAQYILFSFHRFMTCEVLVKKLTFPFYRSRERSISVGRLLSLVFIYSCSRSVKTIDFKRN